MEKELIIMRAIPGGGKSTKAKTLAPDENVYSADKFFMRTGTYIFDASKLGAAHKYCELGITFAMVRGETPLVVDNTNIKKREFKHYVALAEQYGYNVRYEMPDTPWWNEIYPRIKNQTFTEGDVKVFFEKNTHGVPYDKIRQMMENWQEL